MIVVQGLILIGWCFTTSVSQDGVQILCFRIHLSAASLHKTDYWLIASRGWYQARCCDKQHPLILCCCLQTGMYCPMQFGCLWAILIGVSDCRSWRWSWAYFCIEFAEQPSLYLWRADRNKRLSSGYCPQLMVISKRPARFEIEKKYWLVKRRKEGKVFNCCLKAASLPSHINSFECFLVDMAIFVSMPTAMIYVYISYLCLRCALV